MRLPRATGRAPDGSARDVVVGPTTGGVILAFEVARQLGVRGIFAEEVRAADGTARREFRRGFRIEPGERVLLVDDILTTGGSLLAMLPAVEEAGGDLVLAAVLVDRSGGTDAGDLTGVRPQLPGERALEARHADLRAGLPDLSRLPSRPAPRGARLDGDDGRPLGICRRRGPVSLRRRPGRRRSVHRCPRPLRRRRSACRRRRPRRSTAPRAGPTRSRR